MNNIECLAEEVKQRAAALGISPEEYLKNCDMILGDFKAAIPQILSDMLIKHGTVHRENVKLHERILNGARRTHGSF